MYNHPRLTVRVKSIIVETPAIKKFTLQAVDSAGLPPFSGGSHITTYLQCTIGRLERQYSLFNGSAEKGVYEIAVRLAEDSSGGSQYWHQTVKVGDVLTISWPKNYFPLSFRAKHHVFYAAGIGITPFLSMMAELREKGGSFELHYAAKSKAECAFYEFLRNEYPNRCHFYFSNGEAEAKRLTTDMLLEHRIGTHVYVCGPESMRQEFLQAANAYGYPSFNIHYERFAPPLKKEQRPFQVKLTASEKELEVPAETSLLEALYENGVKIPYSCRVGGCGTCEVRVVEGEIEHYDSFLTEAQRLSQQTMLCCVSRGKGRLVLDL